MYFYEVLELCDEKVLTEKFLKLCTESPDLQHTKEVFISFLHDLKRITPNSSGKMTIFIEQVYAVDGSLCDVVYGAYEDDPERYGFELNPWADTLGYSADKNSLDKYGTELFTALVLWEMTWFGYDEDSIRKKVEEWNNI